MKEGLRITWFLLCFGFAGWKLNDAWRSWKIYRAMKHAKL
jgi:hypothetical protein